MQEVNLIAERFNEVQRNAEQEITQRCTACGLCAQECPVIPFSPLKDMGAAEIQKDVLLLITEGKVSDTAYERCYSCTGCLLCSDVCAELEPAWIFELGRNRLRELGRAAPPGISMLLPHNRFNFIRVMEAIQTDTSKTPWYREIPENPPHKDVLFYTGCIALSHPDQIYTLNEIVSRMGVDYAIIGGSDLCCGDAYFRAGDHPSARNALVRLVETANAFSPKKVVFFCSNCQFRLKQFIPGMVDWDYQFITQFLFDNLNKLGTFNPMPQKVTLHDACRFVRCKGTESDSPRKLLQSIPGIELTEMEHSGVHSNCCGGPVIATSPRTGNGFLNFRLKEAEKTGAETLVHYCSGCHSGFLPKEENYPFRIKHLINVVGEAMGICHEDKLGRYYKYHDAARVLEEANANIEASTYTRDQIEKFIVRVFR